MYQKVGTETVFLIAVQNTDAQALMLYSFAGVSIKIKVASRFE